MINLPLLLQDCLIQNQPRTRVLLGAPLHPIRAIDNGRKRPQPLPACIGAFLDQAQGVGKRAHNAQLNAFESTPGFIAGVLVATHLGAPEMLVDGLAVAWVVLRLLYGLCYLYDWAAARSAVFSAALAVTLALFVINV